MIRPPFRRSPGDESPAVAGERSLPLVAQAQSRQAQVSHWLAMALMVSLGLVTLVWYYERQFARQAHLKRASESVLSTEAATEMMLPPLASPGGVRSQPDLRPQDGLQRASAPPDLTERLALPTLVASLSPVAPRSAPASRTPTATRAPAGSAPDGGDGGSSALQRRLRGEVFASAFTNTLASGEPAVSTSDPMPVRPEDGEGTLATGAGVHVAGSPGALLSAPGSLPAAATRLPAASLLLSKGTFIDCTLETAIDSTLPGITTCVTASDTFGADGKVVLLERGTRLFGETQGQVQQGSARIYVLWTEARTPLGVVVPLESPGTDELGRAGLPGSVQRHFWERFGAAMLLSTIDGAVQAGVQASSRNGGTVIYNPGASEDVMTQILKDTVAIAPTVIKRNGDRIEVLVARDVDFASVYALHPTPSGG